MSKRNIIKQIKGQRTMDGAGVHLVRVLGHDDVKDFDPFLMLDSFDSRNPSDYTAGFPMHPHRGIETVTYLIEGRIDHEDSLGHKGAIHSGEAQWMVAGSGILHQEMPRESERMLGFQLWLNMPQSDKMSDPSYQTITKDMISWTESGKAKIGVISGQVNDAQGITPKYVKASLYDIILPKGEEVTLPTKSDENVFVFLIEGNGIIEGNTISEKTAVLFGDGDSITVSATPESDLRFFFYSGKPLRESIAWGGPIVMNTQEELRHSFEELNEGTFIKHQ